MSSALGASLILLSHMPGITLAAIIRSLLPAVALAAALTPVQELFRIALGEALLPARDVTY